MTITQSSTRLVAVVAGVAVAVALIMGGFAAAPAQAAALTQSQIDAIVSLLTSFGADATTINNVKASLSGGTPSGGGSSSGGSGAACFTWTRDLQQGSSGADVKALQVFLNSNAGTMVSASGAGSPGNETSTFGPATKAAVIKFQTANSVAPAAGYFGAKSRAKVATMCSGGTGTVPTPTGPGITVSAAAQPANALAPQGATRVPFTTFTVTNNTGAAVTINGVTVLRTGFGIDA
ncbi:MAG TPA: peptidoglycan-binding domain-containing protein, partial [Candidatus Paceibacterota bacterium]|nr:peptidoglycan-binding domain-containing protein [Candidatus Paceibacterota bacterium]